MKDEIKELTKAEEHLMKVVWKLGKATIKEIAEHMPNPKPAYNTVATVLKVLKGKKFVAVESHGNVYSYSPIILEKEYRRFAFDKVFANYFSGSYQSLLSFLVEEKNIDPQAHERLKHLADQLKDC